MRRALATRAGVRFFRFFARRLNEGTPAPILAGVVGRLLSESEVLALCDDAELGLRPDGVRQAYARGDLCVGAFDKDTLAAYCWLAFAPLPHLDGVWVRFGPAIAWTYKSLVRTSHRGRGIAPALYRLGDAACAERGRREPVICVESHNRPSVSAALHARYRPAGYGGYVLRAMPLLSWCTPAAGAHGVKFFLPPGSAGEQ